MAQELRELSRKSFQNPVLLQAVSKSLTAISFTKARKDATREPHNGSKASVIRAEPPIFEHARMVPAGVVRFMDLDDENYFVMRP
jgi:hypothetical protein